MRSIVLAVGLLAFSAQATEPDNLRRLRVPPPPWPQGDERGMANQIGPATLARCAWHMSQPGARSFELSHAALEHDAALAVRRTLRGQAQAERRHPGYRTCLQFRATE